MTQLYRIELPRGLDDHAIPPRIARLLGASQELTRAFHDQRESALYEQFVASDHALVYQTLVWIDQTGLLPGTRFIEWGCGLAVNACIAASLGWSVVAVEAEARLLELAERIVRLWQQPVDLHHGNFLPDGAPRLADDPYLPSLGHDVPSLYRTTDLRVDDFDIVFAYPWPGEDDFLEQVFLHYAANGAILVSFHGPNDIRVHQKRVRGGR